MTKDSGSLHAQFGGRSSRNRSFSAALEDSKTKSGQYVTMTGDRKRRGPAEPTSHGTRKSGSRPPTSNRENSARASPGGGAVEDIVPRSKAEADILNGTNNTTRHRQLPCRTFISTGFCPYKEHCVYLHDPRLVSSREVRLFHYFNLLYRLLIYPCCACSPYLFALDCTDLHEDPCEEQGGCCCGQLFLAYAQVQLQDCTPRVRCSFS